MKRSSHYIEIPKGTKFHTKKQKSVSAYCWVVYSWVVKVINASLTQNQCSQRVALPLMHAEIPRPLDAILTEQWWHDQDGDVHYQKNRIYQYFERDLKSYDSSFSSHILSVIDLQCHGFSFWKAFVKCPSLFVNGIFDDVRYNVISTYCCCSVWQNFVIF